MTTTEVGTENVTTIDYYLPSMMAYVAVLAGLTYVSITIVDQRERKVLRRYRATPLHPLQVLGAAMTGGAVTVALEVVALALVGVFIFGAHGHGSWLLATIALIVGIASFVSMGFLLTSVVSTSDAARGISALIGFPMLFLSGIFFPVDALPQWIQTIVHVLPVYYVSDALHQILNSGSGLPLIDVAVPTRLGGRAALPWQPGGSAGSSGSGAGGGPVRRVAEVRRGLAVDGDRRSTDRRRAAVREDHEDAAAPAEM